MVLRMCLLAREWFYRSDYFLMIYSDCILHQTWPENAENGKVSEIVSAE